MVLFCAVLTLLLLLLISSALLRILLRLHTQTHTFYCSDEEKRKNCFISL